MIATISDKPPDEAKMSIHANILLLCAHPLSAYYPVNLLEMKQMHPVSVLMVFIFFLILRTGNVYRDTQSKQAGLALEGSFMVLIIMQT